MTEKYLLKTIIKFYFNDVVLTFAAWFKNGHGCMSAFFCAVLSCADRGLTMGRSPSKVSYQNV